MESQSTIEESLERLFSSDYQVVNSKRRKYYVKNNNQRPHSKDVIEIKQRENILIALFQNYSYYSLSEIEFENMIMRISDMEKELLMEYQNNDKYMLKTNQLIPSNIEIEKRDNAYIVKQSLAHYIEIEEYESLKDKACFAMDFFQQILVNLE